jgi:putative ATP-binding cassette transporter
MDFLSTRGTIVVFLAMSAAVAIHRAFVRRTEPLQRVERHAYAALYAEHGQLLSGTKELKLNFAKRSDFIERILNGAVVEYEHAANRGMTSGAFMRNSLHALTWAVMGIVLWGMPMITGSNDYVRGYVLAIMYMWGPFRWLFESLDGWISARIALENIDALQVSLARSKQEPHLDRKALALPRHEIALHQVSFRFESPDGESSKRSFQLGPLSLSLRTGELVFMIGGNGSGKTTLAKVLTGLYPAEGRLLWNGEPVANAVMESYRNLFSAIFADFHLFDHLIGIVPAQRDTFHRYLELFELDEKVELLDGKLSTTSLSTGQRKRLAMIVSLMEDRPFYVFDEWAADQDPEFREVFYGRLLPDLVARGKGALVITHDDRYFGVANRLLRLERGQIAELARPDAGTPKAENSRVQAFFGTGTRG